MKKEIKEKGEYNDLTALIILFKNFSGFSRINASLLSQNTNDLK